MPDATNINPQTVPKGGAAITEASADASNGNCISNDGATWLWLRNSSGADAATVTIAANGVLDGTTIGASHAITVSLALGTSQVVPPLKREIYNSPSGTYAGKINLTFGGAGAASVKVGAFRY